MWRIPKRDTARAVTGVTGSAGGVGAAAPRGSLAGPDQIGSLRAVPAYLDHAATTPLRPEADAAMRAVADRRFGNPSGLARRGPGRPPGRRRGPRRRRRVRWASSRAAWSSPVGAPRPTTWPSSVTVARPSGPGGDHGGRAPRRAARRPRRQRPGGAGGAGRRPTGSSTSTPWPTVLDRDGERRVGDAGQQRGRRRPALRRGQPAWSGAGPATPCSTPTPSRPSRGSTSPRRPPAPT